MSPAPRVWRALSIYDAGILHIRVNGVCPSWVNETGGVAAMSDEAGDKLLQTIPIGRHVTPQDVANVVAYLCSPQSEMIVGQTIVVDGGVTLLGMATN